jgi:glutaredoxin
VWRGALAALLATSLAAPLSARQVDSVGVADLQVFVGTGCPHCERALGWLEDLRVRDPGLRIEVFDVVTDGEGLEALRQLARQHGLGGVTVPTFVVRGQTVHVGFGEPETTGRVLEALLADTLTASSPENGIGRGPASTLGPAVTIPVLGVVALDDVGLPAFTIVLGLLDGFNPCAMWVLLFLISMLLHVPSRARMALVGGVFVAVSGLVYFAFMAAWLNVFLFLGMARGIQVTLGVVALVLGGLNVKDFLWMGRGPSLGIPESAKPSIYARVRKIITADRLGPALASVVVLALLVNTVELLCTAGLPALYTRVLTMRELSVWTYHAYLVLYNLCYMLDDGIMLTVAVVTLSHHRLQEKGARWLKLVSGAVMVGLGVLLLIEPKWLLGG